MIKILFVDDEKGITNLLRDFFKQRGFATFVANSGEEAIEIVKKDKPDIVFLDIKMKGMSGIEALQEIKRYNSSIKVIVLTVLTEKHLIETVKSHGADDFITKPFRVDYLEKVVIDKIQELIGGKK